MRNGKSGARGRWALSVTAALLAGSAGIGLVSLTAAAPPAAAQPSGTASTRTQTFLDDGSPGTVTISKTTDLRRERVQVDWSGFRPTEDIFGSTVIADYPSSTLYPVTIMQCRGHDPTPKDCYYWKVEERKATPYDANDPADPLQVGEVYTIPFRAGDGVEYVLDDSEAGTPDDYNTFRRNTVVSLTRGDGKGGTAFEVRTGDEQRNTIGCGRGQPAVECSLVVVPIRPMPCDPDAPFECANPIDAFDSRYNNFTMAFSASNWRHRFVFPLEFLPGEGFCPLTGTTRLPIIGSELTAEANFSWITEVCRRETDAFPVTYSSLGEGEARRQYEGGTQNFALVTRPITRAGRPTAHAPVTISGFGLAFVIDDINSNPVTELKLSARLVAKLITQTYRGNFTQESAPDFLEGHPGSLFADPEFQALNPNLSVIPTAAVATIMSASGDGDVPEAVTRWIAADAEALSFLRGEPDPWGTRINPAFRGWSVPSDQFELRDGYQAPGPDAPPTDAGESRCLPRHQDTGEVLPGDPGPCALMRLLRERPHALLAQQASRMREFGGFLVTNQPLQNIQEVLVENRYTRVPAQPDGNRALIALTDLATAARYRLPVAKLATGARDGNNQPIYEGPSTDTMVRAVRSSTLDDKTGTLSVDYENLDPNAYPGTMVSYGAVSTAGLDDTTADRYAKWIEYGAGPGQNFGSDAGDLPAGYLSLPPKLQEQAFTVAKAVRDQNGEVPPPPFDDPAELFPTPGGSSGSSGGTGSTGSGNGTAAPAAAPPPGQGQASPPSSAAPRTVATTRADDAGFLRWALPVMLGLGLLAGVIVPLVVVFARPEHPIRRFVVGTWARIRRRGAPGES